MSKNAPIYGSAPYTWKTEFLDRYMFGAPIGNIWWVDSVNGINAVASSSGRGKSPDHAFASVAYAIADASVTANNQDVICCVPNHTETVNAAAVVNVNKAGLRILGLGTGRNRAVFSYSADVAASLDINSANCSISNVVFDLTGVDAVTAGINVKAANFLMHDCEIELANSSGQATLGILTTAAADRMRLERLHIHGTIDAGCATAIRIVGGNDIVLKDLDIIGAFTTTLGGVENNTTAAVNLLMDRCRINNRTASSTKAAVFHSSTTGLISNCDLAILSGSAPLTCAAMHRLRNHYAAAVDTSSSVY